MFSKQATFVGIKEIAIASGTIEMPIDACVWKAPKGLTDLDENNAHGPGRRARRGRPCDSSLAQKFRQLLRVSGRESRAGYTPINTC